MKKFYLGALGCLLAMGASAQTFESVGSTLHYEVLGTIPTKYAYNGEASVYSIFEHETDVELIVYNKSFAVDRTIKVDNPTSYERTVVESREMVMMPDREGRFDCGYKTLDEFFDGSSYYYETKSYPHWWAVNKCTNTTYTDEYVDEYIEYQGRELIEKKEYDGGTLFYYIGSYWGFYFKNNKLLEARYDVDSGELIVCEDCEIEEYYDFYNTQLAVFSQEGITEYINQGQSLPIRTEDRTLRFSYYQVSSIETEADGSIVFLTNIPALKFIWDKELNTLTAVGTAYKQTYTGEWVKEEKDAYPIDYWIWDIGEMSVFCVGQDTEMESITATQTLFNNDEKWEFVRPLYTEDIDPNSYYTYEEDRDGDGEIDYKQTRYRNKLKAYEVVSEDGNVLTTIAVPEEGDSYDLILVLWDGETYLGIRFDIDSFDESSEFYLNIYSIDKIASSVKKIASTPAMRVSPALAERSSTVNVILDVETVKNGGELIITDSNGRTIGRSHVEAGQTSVPVTTDRMCSGVYNITLTEKGQKVENARIIVK